MSGKQKKSSVHRRQRYFPQLEGLKRGLDAHMQPITDRGATGKSVRDADDARARIEKQANKLARRAKQARAVSGVAATELGETALVVAKSLIDWSQAP